MSSIYSREYQFTIKKLRDARRNSGLTQQQLAKLYGKPQSFIAKVENGERRLDIVEFAKLAKLLAIDVGEIIQKLDQSYLIQPDNKTHSD